MGKALDDTQQYARAFQAYAAGNRLHYLHRPWHKSSLDQFIEHMPQIFTSSFLKAPKQAKETRCPIFIVGMPRSGTTLIEQTLASHKNIYGAGELKFLNDLIAWPRKNHQEAGYYAENILQLSSDKYRTLAENYLAYLQRFSPDATRITDKMPYNFIAIGLIHALFPNAKIIHVKRNPMDTCLSCYTKLFTQGHLYSYDLTELGQYYHCYERIMDHWRHLLPSDAWLDVEYEQVVDQLEAEAKRLVAFCDLSWDPNCLAFYQSKRQIRTASLLQVRQPIYTSSLARWRYYEQELAPLINVLNQN